MGLASYSVNGTLCSPTDNGGFLLTEVISMPSVRGLSSKVAHHMGIIGRENKHIGVGGVWRVATCSWGEVCPHITPAGTRIIVVITPDTNDRIMVVNSISQSLR